MRTEDAPAPGNLTTLLRFTKNLGYARVVDTSRWGTHRNLLASRDDASLSIRRTTVVIDRRKVPTMGTPRAQREHRQSVRGGWSE